MTEPTSTANSTGQGTAEEASLLPAGLTSLQSARPAAQARGTHASRSPSSRPVAILRASLRAPELSRNRALFTAALMLRSAGVGLLIWVGAIHWILWHEGYKDIPTIGPFFLVDAIAAGVLAIVLLVWPRPLISALSAAFVAGTIAALVISLTVGLFGFNESLSASHVVEALVYESIDVVILVGWTLVAILARPRRA